MVGSRAERNLDVLEDLDNLAFLELTGKKWSGAVSLTPVLLSRNLVTMII